MENKEDENKSNENKINKNIEIKSTENNIIVSKKNKNNFGNTNSYLV